MKYRPIRLAPVFRFLALLSPMLLLPADPGLIGAPSPGWATLFDGTSLDGWQAYGSRKSWSVQEGRIVAQGAPSLLLFTGPDRKASYTDFEFLAEVLLENDAAAAILFHTSGKGKSPQASGYAVSLKNSPFHPDRDRATSGSLAAVRQVYKCAVRDGEWFAVRIRVASHRIRIFLNELPVVDYAEPADPPRTAAYAGRRLSGGTFALQRQTAAGRTLFRKVQVRPLTSVDQAPSDQAALDAAEKALTIEALVNRGYPVIDFHVHLKGGVVLEDVLEKSRRTGIFCGIAPNCGVGFPIDTNEKLEEFYRQHRPIPVFLAMQAEGREWVQTFRKDSIARFDYVFTDAMTFTDDSGRRMRLWMKDEVGEIKDPQAFMEMYLRRILSVLDREKIDIYINPTFLPEAIAAQYDTLWTRERMEAVTDALARNRIALEINARYRIPSAAFVRLARAKGVKFAFGTNNVGKEYAELDYCLQILKECDLQPADMFFPAPEGRKPIQVR